jgi:hypothetical protein
MLFGIAVLIAAVPFASAQVPAALAPDELVATSQPVALPDSPGALFSSSAEAAPTAGGDSDPQAPSSPPSVARTNKASHFAMTVSPNEVALPMSVGDKVLGGMKDSVSLFSAAGWFASAGWEQLTNGSPNYGTDKGAFGARLGASAIRDISENVLGESFFAPVFREDPRYYIMGDGHNFFKRAIYAATRTLVTRTDGGRETPNFALIAGNAAGSAITVAYYPSQNTSFTEVAKTFGGSMGGSALGFVVTEFIADALEAAHLKRH